MAGRKSTTTAAGEKPTEKEIRIPSKGTMRVYNEALTECIEAKNDAAENLKDATAVAKKGHLHPAAFKAVKALYDAVKTAKNESIAAEKLARYLAQFDEARKFFRLDELAKLQGRMFGVGEIGGDGDPDEPGRELQEDGEPDDRPRHLRQPGASAADHVRALAEQTGASQRADEEHLKGVGKGPTNNKLN